MPQLETPVEDTQPVVEVEGGRRDMEKTKVKADKGKAENKTEEKAGKKPKKKLGKTGKKTFSLTQECEPHMNDFSHTFRKLDSNEDFDSWGDFRSQKMRENPAFDSGDFSYPEPEKQPPEPEPLLPPRKDVLPSTEALDTFCTSRHEPMADQSQWLNCANELHAHALTSVRDAHWNS